jgi:leader peptidase (prepilin peptidase)/N-methyltransferase
VPHLLYIPFLFALGACVGSFLNVVVWRLPRLEIPHDMPWWKMPWLILHGLSYPPSRCPKCGKSLAWYDNIPILGWIKLGGKCRYCKQPISVRYPVVEAITAALFAAWYVLYYMVEIGPCAPIPLQRYYDVPGLYEYRPPVPAIFFLHLVMISALLAASLIDLELTIIPQSIPLTLLFVGLAMHAVFDDPYAGGSLNLVEGVNGFARASPWCAVAAGGSVGLLASLVLQRAGVLRPSFPQGEPLFPGEREELEAENRKLKKAGKPVEPLPPDYTPGQVRLEILKELLFLLPPLVLGIMWWLLTEKVPAIRSAWASATAPGWVTGFLGAALGALIGGATVWIVRIVGTIGFGRLAMGLGDVDLMFGVGACIGAGPAVIAFFIAPFFGLLLAVYLLISGSRRHIPYGPYLSMASAAVLLCYCPIEGWLRPGLAGLGMILGR